MGSGGKIMTRGKIWGGGVIVDFLRECKRHFQCQRQCECNWNVHVMVGSRKLRGRILKEWIVAEVLGEMEEDRGAHSQNYC